jgi:hypothetical protein
MKPKLTTAFLVICLSSINLMNADPGKGVWINGNVFIRDGLLLFKTDKPVPGNTEGDVVLLGVSNEATGLLPAYMKAAEKNIRLRLYGCFMPVAGSIPGHSGIFPSIEFRPSKVRLPGDSDILPPGKRIVVSPLPMQ